MQNFCTDYQNLCEEFKTQFAMTTTYHAKNRMQQRAITPFAIEEISQYGQIIHKQGLKFKYLSKKTIKLFYPPHLQQELQDVMILIANDGAIITTYRHENAVKHVQKKCKRLSKYRNQNNTPNSSNPHYQYAA